MIYACPRCSQKNRLPNTLQVNGEYHCGHCGEPLSPTKKRLPEVMLLLNGVYLLLLFVLTISNTIGPERWWPGSLNLYLPQWIWVVPAIFLVPLTAFRARRLVWLPLFALLWGLGPVMGFNSWGLFKPAAAIGAGTPIRVMTYNVKWGSRDAQAIADDIQKYHPDLIQMQDSAGALNTAIGPALAGWNIRVSGQYIVASQHPLPELESRDISFSDRIHHCVRYTLQIGSKIVTVYNVHLLSPRDGLVAVRHRKIDGLAGNVAARLEESARLAGYIQAESGPVLLTGDLNAPVQSLVCRSLFDAGLRDAFSDAGVGYGYTYGRYTGIRQPYVRIDHVLVSHQWQVTHCVVGNTRGSDHCPVIADLVLP
jgi:vancomycin resistance protein VanJ